MASQRVANKLNDMSKKIAQHLNINTKAFVYRGESLSQWTENLRLLVCKLRRTDRPRDELDKILAKYDWRCARCDEKLGQGYELDHKQPLCDNGSDDMDNMQPLCLPCHAEKCSEERHNIYGKTMYSELNIDVLEGLMDAPKPKHIYLGTTQRTAWK